MDLNDLSYSLSRRVKDMDRFFKTGVYRPSYAANVKAFLREELPCLQRAFGGETFFFMHFADELESRPDVFNEAKATAAARRDMAAVRANESLTRYKDLLKDAYFKGYTSPQSFFTAGRTVFATLCRFARSPLYSVWLAACAWAEALYGLYGSEKQLSPVILSGVFAAAFVYLKAVETGDSECLDNAAYWCVGNSAAESVRADVDLYFFDYPAVKIALDALAKSGTGGFYDESGSLDFLILYRFAQEAAQASGLDGSETRLAALPEEKKKYLEKEINEAGKRVRENALERETVMEDLCAALENEGCQAGTFDYFLRRAPFMENRIKQWRAAVQTRDFVRVRLQERVREQMFKTRAERQRGG